MAPFLLQGLDILRKAVESLIKVNKHCALAFYLKSILPAQRYAPHSPDVHSLSTVSNVVGISKYGFSIKVLLPLISTLPKKSVLHF